MHATMRFVLLCVISCVVLKPAYAGDPPREKTMIEVFTDVLTKEELTEDDLSFEDELVRKLTSESLGAAQLGDVAIDAISYDYNPVTKLVSVDFLIAKPFERFASFQASMNGWPASMVATVNEPPSSATLDVADGQSSGTLTLTPRTVDATPAEGHEPVFVLDITFDITLTFRNKPYLLKGEIKDSPGVVIDPLSEQAH